MLKLNDPTLLRQHAFINNQWVSASDNSPTDVINPFDSQVIGTIPNLTQQQVTEAVEFAHLAQLSWAKKTAKERSDILTKWADLIDQYKEDLATLMTVEQGKPLAEARGEIGYSKRF